MSKTKKNNSQIQPLKKYSAKKNNLKFRLEVPDEDEEDLKTYINEKNEINEILENNYPIIQKVKKNGSNKENESNNNAENEEKRNSDFSEIK